MILAYGHAGSGKSHTIFGMVEPAQPGVLQAAVRGMLAKQARGCAPLLVSIVEVFKDCIR